MGVGGEPLFPLGIVFTIAYVMGVSVDTHNHYVMYVHVYTVCTVYMYIT